MAWIVRCASARADGSIKNRAAALTRNVDGTLTLAFPVEFADYVLESSDDFLSWNSVVAPREEDGDFLYVTLDDTGPTQQYFRLRAPL